MSSANFNNLSIQELKKLLKDKNEGVKKQILVLILTAINYKLEPVKLQIF